MGGGDVHVVVPVVDVVLALIPVAVFVFCRIFPCVPGSGLPPIRTESYAELDRTAGEATAHAVGSSL